MRNIAIFGAAAAAVAFSGIAYANQHEMKDGAKMEAHADHHDKMKDGAKMDPKMDHKMDHKMDSKMDHKMDQKAKVVKQGTGGRAQTVMLNGKEYQVCGGDMTDNCINPREAGLNFGNRALDYWPGKPASEM